MIEQIYHSISKSRNVTTAVNDTEGKLCFDSKGCLVSSIFLKNFGLLTMFPGIFVGT